MPGNPALSNATTPAASSTVTSVSSPVSTNKIQTILTQSSSMNRLQYPEDRPNIYFEMNIAKYSRQSLLKLGSLTSHSTIYLPIPLQLEDQQFVQYHEGDVGMVAGTVLQNGGIEAFNNVMSGGASMKSMTDAAKKIASPDVGAAIGAQAIENLGNGTVSTTAKAFLGYSPNQFMTVLLKGPAYKRFQMSWKFSPKTPAESEILRKIVQLLNNKMAPGLAAGGAVFSFPDIFWLGFRPNSKYLFKYKPAVLINFATNFAPGGIPGFYHGTAITNQLQAPEGVEIRTTFMELEYWITGQFNDSEDPYDTSGEEITSINLDLFTKNIGNTDKPGDGNVGGNQ